jgi:hypothetical protein
MEIFMLKKALYICALFSLVSLYGYADEESQQPKDEVLACDKCKLLACEGHFDDHLFTHTDHDDDHEDNDDDVDQKA